jgi:hypothetical protein
MICLTNNDLRVLQAQIKAGEPFNNVIFTVESTESTEQFAQKGRIKKGRRSRTPSPKYPLKLCVWGNF